MMCWADMAAGSTNSFPNASSFASRALQLDNTLAEAYTARAIAASFWEFNWSAAEQDFQRAMTLDPSSEVAHHFHAEHLLNINKTRSCCCRNAAGAGRTRCRPLLTRRLGEPLTMRIGMWKRSSSAGRRWL
jgi:hypothetical protein